jgi:signal transduction histidine kinase
VRRRIIVSIVGVTTVALVVLGVPLAIAIGRMYTSQTVLRLEREADEGRRFIDGNRIEHGDAVDLHADEQIRYGVYDADGRRVAGSGPVHADAATVAALRGDSNDGRRRGAIIASIPLTNDEKIVGALRASESVDPLVARTRRAWMVMAAIGGTALAIAAMLARRQARRLARPVEDLVTQAERIGGGDFSVRTTPSGISEVDAVGAAIDATARQLGDLVARERAFSADASHQLRTPIAGLRLQVEAARERANPAGRVELDRMLTTLDRLEATVDELLRLARDTHAERPPLDVAALLAGVEHDWRPRFAGGGRSLVVDADRDVGAPAVSEAAVRQVLEVLLANAETHGSGAVRVRAQALPGAMRIAVSDDGAHVLDATEIFRRRSAGNGTHGIGLALGRALAEAEGGRLVLDRPGPRPQFALLLPV